MEVVAGFEGVIIDKEMVLQMIIVSVLVRGMLCMCNMMARLGGHAEKGSLTTKAIGETVNQGEYLGIVASSGCSTGPHLHLEVYDADVQLVDPYEGAVIG